MSIDAHAKSPVAPVAKRIPSYLLPKKKSSPQKQTRRPTPETQVIKCKAVKGNAGAASKEYRTSMVDDAQVESKIEVTQSNSPNEAKDDVAQDKRLDANSTHACLPIQPTLGKLFTEGGLERLLIEVLENVSAKDLGSCLKVCKNTNTVIVKTSSLQVILRNYLYGFGRLPFPKQYRSTVKIVDLRASSRESDVTSRDVLRSFESIQRPIEYSSYSRVGKEVILTGSRLEDVQGNDMLLVHGPIWTVMTKLRDGPLIIRGLPGSSYALCSEDRVVVEVASVSADGNQFIPMKFCSISDCAQNDVSVKHPDIGLGFDRISAFVPDTGSPDSENLVLGKLRLYPGGLAALLLVGNYRCGPTSCGESGLPLIISTRLVLFNWQRGTALGVVKIPDSTVKILDIRTEKRYTPTPINFLLLWISVLAGNVRTRCRRIERAGARERGMRIMEVTVTRVERSRLTIHACSTM